MNQRQAKIEATGMIVDWLELYDPSIILRAKYNDYDTQLVLREIEQIVMDLKTTKKLWEYANENNN